MSPPYEQGKIETASGRLRERAEINPKVPNTIAALAKRYPRLLAKIVAAGQLSSIDEAAVILRDAIALRKNYSEWVLIHYRADAREAVRNVLFG
jgi:hypothetical protein